MSDILPFLHDLCVHVSAAGSQLLTYTSWFKMLILVSWWASQLVVYRWFLNLYSSKSLTGLDYPEDDRCNWWLWLSDETWTGDPSTHKTPCVAQSPVS